MATHQIKNQLITLCKKYTLADTSSVVVPEPYLPYIPQDWNGCSDIGRSSKFVADV